jgi:hypothetical protein
MNQRKPGVVVEERRFSAASDPQGLKAVFWYRSNTRR